MGRVLAKPMDPAQFTESDRRRFWTKVDVHGPGGCWLWTAGRNPKGYGRMGWAGSVRYAHRWSYVLHNGAIDDDLVIDHLCRVPACVNPAHLEPVTHATNIGRGITKATSIRSCPQGHPYSPENTTFYLATDGYRRRECRTCSREKLRKRAATPEGKAAARAYRAVPEHQEAARARNRAYRERQRAARRTG